MFLLGKKIEWLKEIFSRERAQSDESSTPIQEALSEGQALHRRGRLERAKVLYDQVLRKQPGHFYALYLTGMIEDQRGNHERAIQIFDQAIAIEREHAEVFLGRANAEMALRNYQAAIESYDAAITLKHDYAEPYQNRGVALHLLKKHEASIESYGQAIALNPDYAEAYHNRGIALLEMQVLDAALRDFERAIELRPAYAEAYHARGVALYRLNNYAEAVQSSTQAIALRPGNADAHANRAMALYALKQYDAAIGSFDEAIALDSADSLVHGLRLYARLHVCDWVDLENQVARLAARIESGEFALPPFAVLALTDSPMLQKKAAENYVRCKFPEGDALPRIGKYGKHERIRIGYFSADYHNHATTCLMAELFERHDKSKFELIAFSFGPEIYDFMRERVAAAFDRFIDVRTFPSKDMILLARELEIDIAVDLKGFTFDARSDVFAGRAAPIQVNYLGYPGTMSAEFMDYLIADSTLIPDSARQFYSEKIVYLPNSYQANDTRRQIADKEFRREEFGLPRNGFVFCCFNNNYKINPRTFAVWMRILKRVDNSVLWLLENSQTAADNLRVEATTRGVAAERFGLRRAHDLGGTLGSTSLGRSLPGYASLQCAYHCQRCTLGGVARVDMYGRRLRQQGGGKPA